MTHVILQNCNMKRKIFQNQCKTYFFLFEKFSCFLSVVLISFKIYWLRDEKVESLHQSPMISSLTVLYCSSTSMKIEWRLFDSNKFTQFNSTKIKL